MMRTYIHLPLLLLVMLMTTSCYLDPHVMAGRESNEAGEQCEPTSDINQCCMRASEALDVTAEERLLVNEIPGDASTAEMGLASWVVYQIRKQMHGITSTIYIAFGESEGWVFTISALSTLVIIFYFVGVVTGATPANAYALFLNFIKILFVFALASNWSFFGGVVANFIENNVVYGLTFELANLFSGGQYPFGAPDSLALIQSIPPGTTVYTIVDDAISMIYNFQFVKLVLATVQNGPTGWIQAGLILVIIIGYVWIIGSAIFTYLMALIARALLYIVSPLFFVFLLFPQTRSLFDNWLRQLFTYVFLPIFLFAFIGLFHSMTMSVIKHVMIKAPDQEICYREVYRTPGGNVSLYFWQYGQNETERPLISDVIRMLPLLSAVLLLFVMFQAVRWAKTVSAALALGITSHPGGSNILARRVQEQAADFVPGRRSTGTAQMNQGQNLARRSSVGNNQ